MLDLLPLPEDGGCIFRIELVEFLASFVMLLPCLAGVEVRSKPFSAVWEEFVNLGGTAVRDCFNMSGKSRDWLTDWAA